MKRRILIGLLALVPVLTALRADDKAKTPADEYKALDKEYGKAQADLREALKAAKTPAARKDINKKGPDAKAFAQRFLALAEKNPKDKTALDAYAWVVSHVGRSRPAEDGKKEVDVRGPALRALRRDFLTSEGLGPVCQALRSADDKDGQDFLRAALAQNPHPEVQALACLALAASLNSQVTQVRRAQSSTEGREQAEKSLGKEQAEQLLALDAAKLAAESEQLFKRAAVDYSAKLSKEELTRQCQSLAFSYSKGADTFLRHVLEKSEHREAQAAACMALASGLRNHADTVRTLRGGDDELRTAYESAFGKEGVHDFLAEDEGKCARDSEAFLKRAAADYMARMSKAELARHCQSLAYDPGKGAEFFLRSALEKSDEREVRWAACLALAGQQRRFADAVRQAKDADADHRTRDESYYGKDALRELLAVDPAKVSKESEDLYTRAATNHAPQVAKDELARQCQMLGFSYNKGAEKFLRHVLDNNDHREVKGAACLALANGLRQHVDAVREAKEADGERRKSLESHYGKAGLAELRAADAGAALRECIHMFDTVVADYADLKDARGRTYEEAARAHLYEIDALSVGKTAPDIRAEDVDARPLNLSDYRGKVVLLDFWGHW